MYCVLWNISHYGKYLFFFILKYNNPFKFSNNIMFRSANYVKFSFLVTFNITHDLFFIKVALTERISASNVLKIRRNILHSGKNKWLYKFFLAKIKKNKQEIQNFLVRIISNILIINFKENLYFSTLSKI